jgi:HlyD family secretion protein
MTVEATAPVRRASLASQPVRRRGRRLAWVLALALGAGLAFAWYLSARSQALPRLETARVERGEVVSTVAATGALEATTTVTVGSQVSGIVQEILVDFNSPVRRGQVMVVLDPSEFQARVSQAQAALDSARASLESATAGQANAEAAVAQAQAGLVSAQAAVEQAAGQLESARADLASAQAAVDRARAQMDNALAEYQRYEKLSARDLVARSDLDQKRTAYRVATADYETARAGVLQARANARQMEARLEAARADRRAADTRLAAARAQARSARAQVTSARAQVRQAQANLNQALVNLERTRIRSPIDGVVIQRKVDVGQTVAAAFQAPELIVIARDLHQMQVKAQVNEADIGQVREGQKVEFTVDAYPERRFEGRVVEVRSSPETARSGSNVVVYGVLVDAPNPDLLLKPGMTASVKIEAAVRKGALVVPNEALRYVPPPDLVPPEPSPAETGRRRRPGGRVGTVWVKKDRGLQKRELTLGVSDGKVTEVLQGDLSEGDEVVVDAGEPGQPSPAGGRRRRFFF